MTVAAPSLAPAASASAAAGAPPPDYPSTRRPGADAADPLLLGLAFVARFFGQPADADSLRADAPLNEAGRVPASALSECAARGGLAVTPLKSDPAKLRATMLPMLAMSADAATLFVVIGLDRDLLECHVPGIEGTRWIDRATILAELQEGASWAAVRPALFFDQRSLLYTFDQPLRWFWDVFDRNRWIFKWALLGTIALNIFGALLPFFSMAVYDRVVPNNAVDSLWVLTSAAALLIGFELVMKMVRGYLLESAAKRMDVALSATIFSQCLKLRAANRPASGGVLANVVRDFESVREFFASSTLTLMGDLPFMLVYLVVIGLIGGWLVLVPIAMMPLLFVATFLVRKPLASRVAQASRESAQRTAHLFETMNGLDAVKALGAEAWSRRKWEQLTVAIADNSLHTRELVANSGYASASLLTLANIVIVVVGALLIGEQKLTMGQLIGVTMLASRALGPAAQMASLMVRWQQTRLSMQSIEQIMKSPTDEITGALHAPQLAGRIEFRDVSFAYPHTPPLLDKLNLHIRPGERVGFIGRLGSGKSTLLKLVLNLYGPQTGSVLIDDMVSTQLEPLSLRRQLGYVPQDVPLFHGSIRDNIELGRNHGGDDALLQAVRTACLDDILTQLPNGLGTQVGERGDRLSGGQRQAVAIARALVTRPPVLLLDEPSSMMDPATEQRLIVRLRELKDTTLLLVTHRMAMLPLIDRLIVLDRGRIVADGPRDEVLKALANIGGGPNAQKPAAGVPA
ncbi:type I secretion system permease/ATPase [soil metagenome]